MIGAEPVAATAMLDVCVGTMYSRSPVSGSVMPVAAFSGASAREAVR